jgi:preprotein translocase subunit SecF
MEFFRIKKDIPFMRHALIFNVISALTFVAAVFFLWHNGLHLSIEFTGGTVLELNYAKPANVEKIRTVVTEMGFADNQVTSFGTAQDVLIRLPLSKGKASAKVSEEVIAGLCKAENGSLKQIDTQSAKGEALKKTACADAAGVEVIKLQKVEFVGPQVGQELTQDGINALVMVVVLSLIHI